MISVETLGRHRELLSPEREETRGTAQHVALHEDVVRDRDHVEPPRPSVQIDDLADRQAAVAPLRVDVEVAQEKRFVAWHLRPLRPHVQMLAIGGAMAQNLRPEISHIETYDLSLPHRAIAPGRCPDPTIPAHLDRAARRQAAAQIRVLAMEFDATVEAADRGEGVSPDREISAIQDGADPERVVYQRMRRRRDHEVVRTNQCAPVEIPIVETIRPRDADDGRAPEEPPLDPLEPR